MLMLENAYLFGFINVYLIVSNMLCKVKSLTEQVGPDYINPSETRCDCDVALQILVTTGKEHEREENYGIWGISQGDNWKAAGPAILCRCLVVSPSFTIYCRRKGTD